ncbi:MAG: chromophore lyase CpcT/CpeT [Microcoleus sp. PH2017_29_MFU_D_A]|jgi:CpeT protein|uniref:chromophore lyase CpcT/CpeT n=1 Tax=unclassified Microcoleus TaxID=2642155 RepID=UPI001D48ECB7|nr:MULTISPECIES: chromophore lyase CpcT/CpeT [unclassified Microcoleus]MCC3505173.1 chromophore lyase CpcT/CpeT [Microcoleus sp. PH2017_19_SFW_U_A]TAE09735.1 MAG: chorismate-binding protein [Oscillatoriales cyanobacterium]MCC3415927.1 chromophore lyase CpcT/CpeT [Microcoleus sp. PH2017_02_FOX_O_A]MCC3455955.1 chromophore lyase CpcT/CpeT [Microcoleus sp. PH2017_08_TRC_O_A]MCC3498911.1 chromophore lyase CpcT/CpeT [Microcoleus sp. PH2017_15_JOR_U_A]
MNSVKTNNDLITLAQWMAGDFSNYKQSFEKPQQFAHIHIFFRPLPFDFFNAIGFYSEQVYDHDLWTPYRQGVHKLIDQGEQIYIENYSLNDPVQYAGAARELSILKTIKPDCIQRRYNCSMVFKREGEMFRGSVEPGNQCLIEKKGCSTYLISDVEITETTWSSLDRGMDVNTHEQIWGSENGSLWFEKRQSFAGELPPL